ncbi:MAG: YceI family protein [Bacteroidia bacterium]
MSQNTLVNWSIDAAHSSIQFKVRHLVISTVTGTFTSYRAQISSEGENLSKVNVRFEADVASVSTGQADRDKHLLSEDFFYANKFPHIHFEGVDVTRRSDRSYIMHGNLSIRGVSLPVDLDVEINGIAKDPYGNTKAGLTIRTRINRKEFGLNFHVLNEAGNLLVGDEVRIEAEVQLAKQSAE